MKISTLFNVLIFCLIFATNVFAKNSNSFNEGKKLYLNKKFEESKFFFEKDLVFNPKNSKSYLYLAKIYKEKENIEEEQYNLQNVLLLDPKNDEAIYLLIMLKIEQSNYKEARDLIDNFNKVCDSFCSKKKDINEKFSKLIPENE
tara:strand:- start:21 stop:455 length:435 start_codon:yes stop_codon:yes gene_type:complete